MIYFTILNGESDLSKSESTTITANSLEEATQIAKMIYKSDNATAVFQDEIDNENDEY